MTQPVDCFMCQDSMFTGKGSEYPQKIADLDVSTAILNQGWQYFRSTTILVFRDHVTDLHDLTTEMQHRFIDDGDRMATALKKTYPHSKLNHGLFGNTTPHLHWHIIIHRGTDPNPKSTIWETEFPKLVQTAENFQKTAEEIRRNL